jgi:hypothetical protein
MGSLVRELHEARFFLDRERIMLQLARSANAAEATNAIEPYLTDDDWLTRCAAAFALGFVPGPSPDSLILTLGGSEVPEMVLASGGDTRVEALEDAVRNVAAYALAMKRDERSVPRLIRMLRHQDRLNSRRFRGSDYEEFSKAVPALLPKESSKVNQLYGPVIEHLLLSLGPAAIDAIIRSLNWGGMMNELLCGPLMLVGWKPSNATEEFFSFLIDRSRTTSERDRKLDSCDFLDVFAESDISLQTLVRSLIWYAGDHDPHLRCAIAPLVCDGVLPLWKEVERSSQYSERESRALRGCLTDMLQRPMYTDRMKESTRAEIEQALRV